MPRPKLKLVVPNVQADKLEGYEPLLLADQQLIERYWPQTAAVLERCVDKAMHGEMTVEDIYGGVRDGRLYALVAKNDDGELPDVALALIFELMTYPQYAVLNITALGGRQLNLLKTKFWKHVCSWAYMNGVRTLQASVSPAMARILKNYGFEQTYITVRMNLTEM